MSALSSEDEFQGFVLKGKGASAANIPGPLPRYGAVAGLNYMITAAPVKEVKGSAAAHYFHQNVHTSFSLSLLLSLLPGLVLLVLCTPYVCFLSADRWHL